MSRRVPASMRRELQERARHRCEYCLVHERDAVFGHEPDHILSKRHGGKTTLLNLAWACFDCNRIKSSDLSSVDLETGRIGSSAFSIRAKTIGKSTFEFGKAISFH